MSYPFTTKSKPRSFVHAAETPTSRYEEREPTHSPPILLSRIPLALQAVFLASNRGHNVHEPPPNQAANRIFGSRFWNRRRFSRAQKQKGQCQKQRQQQKPPLSPSYTEHSSESTESSLDYNNNNNNDPIAVLLPAGGGSFLKRLDKLDSYRFNKKPVAATPPTPTKPDPPRKINKVTPQCYLNGLMRSRGYPVVAYDSLQTAYYNTPTDLQKASYDVHLIDLVKNRQIAELRDCLAIGLSTNPCNAWGESVLHLVCRHGSATDVLQVFLGAGADVQVVDDYGRTPLHDACWSVHPCLDSIALLLDRDVNLLHMRDCRGALPLSYVPESHWANWMAFLSDNKDRYFPTVGTNSRPLPSPLTQQAPHTRPVLDPPRALPLDVARMVASGRMTPAEVLLLFEEDSEDEEDSSLDDDEENYDDNDEDYSYEEDGDDRDNSSTLCSDSYADDDMNASQDAETRNMNPHHDKASSCHRDQVQVPKSNAGMDGIGRNVGIADDEHSDDEDDSDFDDMDSEEDDDDSVLDEVVGRLGIARPYYYQKAHGNASDKIIEPQDDSPLPPMASVVVDDRVTQDFFRPLARDAERASCLSAFSKQIPTAEPLIQEHRNSSMTEELLEFSC